IENGVPAAFIIPGRDWEGLSPEEEQRLFERWDRYHQRGDEWKPDFPWAGLQRYAEFGLALGRHVADAPGRPRLTPWTKTDVHARRARPSPAQRTAGLT